MGWSRVTFGQSKSKIQEKQRILEELTKDNTVGHLEEIRRVKEEINTILYHEEIHWRQRSRSIWLQAGDKNKKFFHQKASQRRQKNNISGIFDREGVWQETNGMFATKTSDEIMAIPLSRDRQRDTLIWKENRKHEFSVKSAYQVALRLKQGVEVEH